MRDRLINRWRQFWLWRGGFDRLGRLATWMGSLGVGTHRQLHRLVWIAPPRGFIASSACVVGVDLRMGSHVFVGERVVIAQWDQADAWTGGERERTKKAVVQLGDHVQLNREVTIELSGGGSVSVGRQVGIQMRCFFQAAGHPIRIGDRSMIAPYCALLSGETGENARSSQGPIDIGDDSWLGVGVKVLGGVTIGKGAIVAAGSVVTSDIPPGALAAGNPARLIRRRVDLTSSDGQRNKPLVSEAQ
ncbi:MAG: DapH/DapD/GlmU-related protein [Verrucomicrobiia bacterium]